MRMPWNRKPELRATTNFYDGVIDQLQAQLSTRATDAGSTAALESCAGQLSRAFMGATVEGPDMVTSAITPGVLGQIGRDLIRGGASLWRIDTAGGRVRLFEAADWYWFQGRDSDPAGWRVRLTTYGPSGSETRVMPWDSVCWFTFGRSTATPWVGRGPASWAPLTAKLAAEAERTLGDEAGGPIANLVPVPQDAEPDDDGNSKFDGLTGDISAARGRALLLETTYAGHGEGRASAPQRDWVASRLGPNPPASMVEAARDSFARMVAACGSNVSLFSDADGTAQREALRRWHMGTVLPLARLVEHELTAKLETPVSLRFDLHATDLAGRAGAFKGLVGGGMEIERALAVTGLLIDD